MSAFSLYICKVEGYTYRKRIIETLYDLLSIGVSDTAAAGTRDLQVDRCCLVSGPDSKYNNNADILKSSRIYSPPALVLGAGHPDWLRCVTRPKNCSFQKDTKTNDVDIRH